MKLDTLKPKDILILKDEASIKRGLNAGIPFSLNGIQHEVKSIISIKERNGLCEFKLISFEDDLFLFVKSVDDLTDYRLMAGNDWLTRGTREELINNGHNFVFAAPKDVNNFAFDELEFAESFNLVVGGQDVYFGRKAKTLFGELTEEPKGTGIEYPLLAAITEYSTASEIQMNEILIMETGNLIVFIEGYNLKESEIEAMSA